jgi:hypothetical protein
MGGDTLWKHLCGREIYEISPRALDVTRKVLHLPSKRLVEAKFVERPRCISEALLDADKMDELIRIWERANLGLDTDHRVILAVDAVSFRPSVVITEDGTIEGPVGSHSLESPNLFTQFAADPQAFMSFL